MENVFRINRPCGDRNNSGLYSGAYPMQLEKYIGRTIMVRYRDQNETGNIVCERNDPYAIPKPVFKVLRWDYDSKGKVILANKRNQVIVTTVDEINTHKWYKKTRYDDIVFMLPDDIRESITEEEYNERINTLINLDIESRINEIYQVRKENDESIKIAKDKYNLDGETIDLIGVLRDFTFLHTYTAQNTDHLFYTGRHTLFKEIEKRINISDNDIVSMGDNEILELLSKKIDKETALKHVQDRKKGFAITWLDSKVYSVFGNEANYIANEVSNRYKVIKDGEYE